MSKIRLQPPPKGTRVGDWLNQSVICTRELKNQCVLLPEGSKGIVTEVRFGKGLTVLFEECPCCHVAPIMAGLSHEDINLCQ